MINLKRIIEQQGADGQYYDLGKDFANFRRSIDGTFDQIKQKFEQIIGAKLNGKRVRARASRGYKQYVKDYDFDITKVTLDDYYDNYVVVAHDNTTPKAKEYFLKPGFKIQVLGPATGQSTQDSKVQKPVGSPASAATVASPDKAQSQPMAPAGAQKPMDEVSTHGSHDAYSIDTIGQDIKGWLPRILVKPETAIRDFVVGLGWLKQLGKGHSVAMFDLKLPVKGVKVPLTDDNLKKLVKSADRNQGTITTTYDIVHVKPNTQHEEVVVRIKKTMRDQTAI